MEFSLIYNFDNSNNKYRFQNNPNIFQQLDVNDLLWDKWLNLTDFLTDDIKDIKYRQNPFSDLIKFPKLADLCNQAVIALTDMEELRKMKSKTQSNESMLYSIKEIDLYINLVNMLAEGFYDLNLKIESEAFKKFTSFVLSTYHSEEFNHLKEQVSKASFSIRNIKSVTVGMNLDARMTPYEAGLLSINTEYIYSGELIDRILRCDGKRDEFRTIAPLVAVNRQLSQTEKTTMNTIFYDALKKVFSSQLRNWEVMCHTYFTKKTTDFLLLLPELRFLCVGVKIIRLLQKYKLPLCNPSVFPMEDKRFSVTSFYNPVAALRLKEINSKTQIIFNDITFDDSGMIFILTGPNRGGKSVYTCAIGIVQLFFQLGLPVPAEKAELSPVDCIYTHFPTPSSQTFQKGRLGEECERLQAIFKNMSEYSLVLLDESLSSTDSYEGSVIASEIVICLSALGCRAVYSTHLHELAARVDEMNQVYTRRSKIDTLVAGIENNTCTYIIKKAKPDGKSHARSIADKYGLSLAHIMKLRQNQMVT